MVVTLAKAIKAIYTDGACSGNPGPGGWGVVIQFTDGSQHELGGHAPQSTNNRMELQASIEALSALKTLPLSSFEASLHTDSEYVKNGITKWLPSWKKRGWKTAQGKAVLNQDLWEALDELNSDRIQWHYVRAHVGHPGNERADAIARAFSLRHPISLRQIESRPMTAEPIDAPPTVSEPSEAHDSRSLEPRAQRLRDLLEILELADAIAAQGYLITSAELADLMDIHASAVTSRGDQWVWRNWEVSRVRREGNQILWQLQQVDDRL
jgi:ribonuclease HI